jgi:energy-converting hydrogenase Eha subunit H
MQLGALKLVFAPAASDSITSLPKTDAAAMRVYAGQEMTTGAQAQTYADHFIAVHLGEIGGGLTYSQLSAKAMADPKNTVLAGQVATVFKGTTLRGMLLNAYGFWQMGQIALIAAIAAFAGAALMLILSLAGAWHLRRVPEAAEVFNKVAHREVQTV